MALDEISVFIPECQNCRYWYGSTKDGMAECVRHAPVLVDADGAAIWPKTGFHDFCGDHVLHEDG